MYGALPGRGAHQGLACGTVGNVCSDHREDEPRDQKPPPVKLGGEVQRNHPHLEQSHQLEENTHFKVLTHTDTQFNLRLNNPENQTVSI